MGTESTTAWRRFDLLEFQMREMFCCIACHETTLVLLFTRLKMIPMTWMHINLLTNDTATTSIDIIERDFSLSRTSANLQQTCTLSCRSGILWHQDLRNVNQVIPSPSKIKRNTEWSSLHKNIDRKIQVGDMDSLLTENVRDNASHSRHKLFHLISDL